MNSGVKPVFQHHLAEHRRDRCLSVSTADAYGLRVALHQLAEQICALDRGNSEPVRFNPLRVFRADRRRINDQIGAVYVFSPVADHDLGSFFPRKMNKIGFIPVAARHMISLIQKHLSQTAHAAAAEPDHMDASAGIVPDMRCAHT